MQTMSTRINIDSIGYNTILMLFFEKYSVHAIVCMYNHGIVLHILGTTSLGTWYVSHTCRLAHQHVGVQCTLTTVECADTP